MGDGRDRQAQATAGVASAIVDGHFEPGEVVGKRTLTGDTGSPTGDEYIDHHALCTRMVSHDCFLGPETRTALITDYQRRVSDAHNAYERALLSIRIDQLVKKDDELPWFVALLLDVAGAECLGQITRTLKLLKADQLTALTAAGALDATAARRATATASATYVALSMVSDAQLTTITKAAFDTGKKTALAGLKAQYDREKSDAKTATLSYAARLSEVAELAFDELATKPAAQATDAQLLVLWKAFQPPAHNQEVYKALLEAKIARYLTSGIRDIGRTGEAICANESGSCSAAQPAMRDTVVVRVTFKSGYPDRFAFATQEWTSRTADTLPTERSAESELPLDQAKFHGLPISNESRLSARPSFQKFIDPEFVDAAIERHLQVWGRPPETIEADDSTWVWDKSRAQSAKDNKAMGPGPFGIPRLQLPSPPDARIEIPEELRLKGGNP